jgi:hypothetical protein
LALAESWAGRVAENGAFASDIERASFWGGLLLSALTGPDTSVARIIGIKAANRLPAGPHTEAERWSQQPAAPVPKTIPGG